MTGKLSTFLIIFVHYRNRKTTMLTFRTHNFFTVLRVTKSQRLERDARRARERVIVHWEPRASLRYRPAVIAARLVPNRHPPANRRWATTRESRLLVCHPLFLETAWHGDRRAASAGPLPAASRCTLPLARPSRRSQKRCFGATFGRFRRVQRMEVV